MPLILPGNVASATASTTFEVANSCRFDDGDSPHMTKTPDAGDVDKWTWSCWVKRCTLGTQQTVISGLTDGSNYTKIQFETTDQLHFYNVTSASTDGALKTTRFFRDPAAWYHIVCVWDSDNGTAGDRMKMYINGVEETLFAKDTNPSQDLDSHMNAAVAHYIGQEGDGSKYFDGYLAEMVFIDGSALAATSFGEFDSDSPQIWKPIDVSGLTFGDNGTYLDFEDSGNLGDDESGNTNDWGETNLAAIDQATDTPTNNFCTLSSLWVFANRATLSQGNCKAVGGGAWNMAGGTVGLTAGKWYWEIKMTTIPGGGSNGRMGVFDSNVDQTVNGSSHVFQQTGTTWWYNEDGGEMLSDNTATTADYGELDQGDILGIALNMDDGQITIYDQNSASVSNYTLSSSLETAIPASAHYNETVEYNFGGCSAFTVSSAANDENGYGVFEFAPPSGYLAVCSKNLGSDGG